MRTLKTKKKPKENKSDCKLCAIYGRTPNKETIEAMLDIKYNRNLTSFESLEDLIKHFEKPTPSNPNKSKKTNKKSLSKS